MISIDTIKGVFTDAIESIQQDCAIWYSMEKDMVYRKLKHTELAESDRQKFLHLNNIRGESGLDRWSSKYLVECLNDIYVRLITRGIRDEIEYFMELLFDPQVSQELDSLLEKIKTKEKEVLKLKNRHRVDGMAITRYLENKSHGTNSLLYDRFKIIIELNTEYGQSEDQRSSTADYPFFEVNGAQFYDFEFVFRFMAMFKAVSDLLKSNIKIKEFPLKINSPIFYKTGEDIFYTILLLSRVIEIDPNMGINRTSQFRGACCYLYTELQRKRILKNTTTKTAFIEYLNEAYEAGFKNPENSVIANEKSTHNARGVVESILSDLLPDSV